MLKLEENVLYQIKLTKNIIENEHNRYLKPYGLSTEQGLMLKFVHNHPGFTQTQIAEHLHKDKTTITRMIDGLVKKGKLKRVSAKDDRRVFRIHITREADEHVFQLSPMFDKQDDELKQLIGEEDYARTLLVLEKIKNYYRGLNR